MSAKNLIKNVFSNKTSKKDWAPISMMAKFVRERDVVKFEENEMEVLVQTDKPSAVVEVDQSAKAVIVSETVKSDIIEIKDYEDNTEDKKAKSSENGCTEEGSVIYLWMLIVN